MAKRKLSQSKKKKLERCIKSVKKTQSRKCSAKRYSGVRCTNPWAVCKASTQRRKSLKKSFSTNKR